MIGGVREGFVRRRDDGAFLTLRTSARWLPDRGPCTIKGSCCELRRLS